MTYLNHSKSMVASCVQPNSDTLHQHNQNGLCAGHQKNWVLLPNRSTKFLHTKQLVNSIPKLICNEVRPLEPAPKKLKIGPDYQTRSWWICIFRHQDEMASVEQGRMHHTQREGERSIQGYNWQMLSENINTLKNGFSFLKKLTRLI
jgi:hypothetical protein